MQVALIIFRHHLGEVFPVSSDGADADCGVEHAHALRAHPEVVARNEHEQHELESSRDAEHEDQPHHDREAGLVQHGTDALVEIAPP